LVWKIWKKGKLNSEKIWKMWKKSRLKCEMIWKIWKKGKLKCEMILQVSPHLEKQFGVYIRPRPN
jgi:hypothetical protein